MAKKKTKRITRAIVAGYLEKVSSRIFEQYRQSITEMITGHQGLYALYRRDKLYYVGLATNLKSRIRYHLRDRHQGKWTHFSLYIIRKADHIKELESLLLRIADPAGNSIKGNLTRSKNLLPVLKKQVKHELWQEYEGLFEIQPSKAKTKKKKIRIGKKSQKDLPLKGILKPYQRIYASYQGTDYKAKVKPNGTIQMIPDRSCYESPSAAGKAIRNRSTNGWAFWKYKDENGELQKLAKLRS